jgi:hypothetical protein
MIQDSCHERITLFTRKRAQIPANCLRLSSRLDAQDSYP